MQATLQQSNAAKVVGALLSQVAGLPEQQLRHWCCVQEGAWEQASPLDAEQRAPAIATWLQRCCSALGDVQPLLPQPQPQLAALPCDRDPVLQLLHWALAAMTGSGSMPGVQQQQQRQQRGQLGSGAQQMTQAGAAGGSQLPQQQQHPAEALRQVLDVLLSALVYRHALSMHQ